MYIRVKLRIIQRVHKQKNVARQPLINHAEINFDTILSITYVKEMPNLHIHTLISVSFGVVKFCSLRGEGRRSWKGRVKNEERMKHMITLKLIEFSFC